MRLALSKLDLKTSSSPSLSVTAFIWRASFKTCSSDWITLGPAMMKKGCAALICLKNSDSCDQIQPVS